MDMDMDLDPALRGPYDGDPDADDASDADSDMEELQSDMNKFNQSVRQFLATRMDPKDADAYVESPPDIAPGGPRGKVTRGPRKAARPRGDITARLSRMNMAFVASDFDLAMEIAFEIIRINSETHQAWTALHSIFREQGDESRALSAMVFAAHLRPKEVGGWLESADYALNIENIDDTHRLHTARLCFSAALRIDKANVPARIGKADVCHQQGHLQSAAAEYARILAKRPGDLDLVRKLAEVCIDNQRADPSHAPAIDAYRRCFDLVIQGEVGMEDVNALWHDVGIYVDLVAAAERHGEAIVELRRLARWLVGRVEESYWDEWTGDDREWDDGSLRRYDEPRFVAQPGDMEFYGKSLPLDLRVRLAIFRLKMGDVDEGLMHLSWLDCETEESVEFIHDFAFLFSDLSEELLAKGSAAQAIQYLEVLHGGSSDADAALLLRLGRCYVACNDNIKAEEYFIGAIDADFDNIDARIELANMYEKAREDEEALILAAEAMALQEAQQSNRDDEPQRSKKMLGLLDRAHRGPRLDFAGAKDRPSMPRRYRPKRLAGLDTRRKEEEAHAQKLAQQFDVVRNLKKQIAAGNEDLVPEWMASSKALVDDFRSLKEFYRWDKYLQFLGSKKTGQESDLPGTQLSIMYERLTHTLANRLERSEGGGPALMEGHQGISFSSWLDLFLDYAIGLAIDQRRDESYQVCEAAAESTVFQSPEQAFTIYTVWSACAVYANDEEKCVAIARHLMKEERSSDCCRLFAVLALLCQSPISWYASGPTQKYLLRRIKFLDAEAKEADDTQNAETRSLRISMLTLYGHLLTASTSYTFALSYFLRARALDPDNIMINLSLGLSYTHCALKRQTANRHHMLLQGQTFIRRYIELSALSAEALYNLGRWFQLLGIHNLASEYYRRALALAPPSSNLRVSILVNTAIAAMHTGNHAVAMHSIRHIRI